MLSINKLKRETPKQILDIYMILLKFFLSLTVILLIKEVNSKLKDLLIEKIYQNNN